MIKFFPDTHTYLDSKGKKLTSVTTLIGELKHPFDRDKVAKRTAIKKGTTAKLLIKEWEEIGRLALKKGNKVHTYIEQFFKMDYLREGKAKRPNLQEILAFESFWRDHHDYLTPYHLEYRVGNSGLGIAGTVDGIFLNRLTKKFHVYDWKTGKKFTMDNQWQNLKPPFQHLQDCNYNVYSLQVSLYKLLLKRQGYRLSNSYIIHFKNDQYRKYEAQDFSQELLDWILTK